MKTRYSLAWIFLFLNLSVVNAQFGGLGNSGGSAPSPQAEVEPDTFDVQHFYQDNIDYFYPFSDTLLDNRFEQYDPARRRVVDYAQLGNLGTAYYPQLYESSSHKGLDIGFHQYDLYTIDYKDIPFYKVDKPFSDLYFTQGPTQQDTYFKGKFTRNFGKNANFSVDFKRMNNVGQFKSQAAVNTAFGIGFWLHHPGGKYDSFITYTSNTNEIEDNGGVDRESITSLNTDRVFNIPVFLRSANTFYLRRSYGYTHQYNLLGVPDSSKQAAPKRKLILGHDFVYKTNRYKFYDTDPPADTIYYGEQLLIDTRGLRYFIQDNSLENTFSISTSKSGDGSQRDLLKVSLEHQIHFLNQEPRDSTINQLILGGQWNFAPSERLKVKTHLSYNLWDNFGDYRLGGDLFLDFKKVGNLKASLVNQLYSPSLIQQRMFVSEQLLWENDFDKTFENSISATYSIPQLRFSVTGNYHLINNLIYFDTLALPKQSSSAVNILQLVVNQNFKLWKLHLDNTLALQSTTRCDSSSFYI